MSSASAASVLISSMFLAACARPVADPVPERDQVPPTMFSESEAYEQFMGRWSRQLAPRLVAFAAVQDGDDVLDVGSGTGAVAAAVLDATASARVVGIDPAGAYVAYARSRTRSERVSFEEGDAQHLRFPNAQFDQTLALLVMNFIPAPDRALSEMVRVTRPGGTVAAAVWDYGEGMQMLRLFWDEAVALDPASASRDERHMRLCRPGELATLWRQQGLVDVVETPLVTELSFRSFEDFWSPFLKGQGPAGAYVASLSEAKQQLLRDRLQERVAAGADGSFTLTARAWAVKGTVPSR